MYGLIRSLASFMEDKSAAYSCLFFASISERTYCLIGFGNGIFLFVDFREHRCCLVSIISENDSTMFGSKTVNVALFSIIKRRELSVYINKTVACFLLLGF